MTTNHLLVRIWLLSHLLHPLVFFAYSLVWNIHELMSAAIVFVFLAGLFFSVPALLLCMPLLRFSVALPFHHGVKFFVWILSIVLSLAVSEWILCQVFFRREIFLTLFLLSIPGLISALAASALHYKQFRPGCELTTYEDDPVYQANDAVEGRV